MTSTTEVLERYPLQLDARTLRSLLNDLDLEIQIYESLVKRFESQYGCDLKTFEDKMKRKELPEHPTWETSIEWGTAVDERERLGLMKSALEWILGTESQT